jgi:hypothetical protein
MSSERMVSTIGVIGWWLAKARTGALMLEVGANPGLTNTRSNRM